MSAPGILSEIRASGPVVYCLTNQVTSALVAGALEATGAHPIMSLAPAEAAAIAGRCAAIMLNLGTPSRDGLRAARIALAHLQGRPWVLDPVGAGASPWRTKIAAGFARLRPAAIRCNAAEAAALVSSGPAGGSSAALRGVSSAVTATPEVASRLAARYRAIACVTGPVDLVAAGGELAEIPGGHPWSASLTGSGCALSALLAAALSVRPGRDTATEVLAGYKRCAAKAARIASGPGTLPAALLDALYEESRS